MAGTRLWIQCVTLIELLLVASWAFYYGFCRKDDILCRKFGDWKQSIQMDILGTEQNDGAASNTLEDLLGPVASIPSFPPIQILEGSAEAMTLPDSSNLLFEENPDTRSVCNDANHPHVSRHLLWYCKDDTGNDNTTFWVIRQSSLIVRGGPATSDWDEELLRPMNLHYLPPRRLNVHLLVEDTDEEAPKLKLWSERIDKDIVALRNWPIVDSLNVQLHLVPPKWMKRLSGPGNHSGTDATNSVDDPVPLKTQQDQLQNLMQESAELRNAVQGPQSLVIYLPFEDDSAVSTWKLNNGQSLLLVGGWDLNPVHNWLGYSWLGPAYDALGASDTDGSFPNWFLESYWVTRTHQVRQLISRDFPRVQHLWKDRNWIPSSTLLTTDPSSREYFEQIQSFHSTLVDILESTSMTTHFPIEHYAAIFAPLLFPLLVPFALSLAKEYRRYKQKTMDHENVGGASDKGS